MTLTMRAPHIRGHILTNALTTRSLTNKDATTTIVTTLGGMTINHTGECLDLDTFPDLEEWSRAKHQRLSSTQVESHLSRRSPKPITLLGTATSLMLALNVAIGHLHVPQNRTPDTMEAELTPSCSNPDQSEAMDPHIPEKKRSSTT